MNYEIQMRNVKPEPLAAVRGRGNAKNFLTNLFAQLDEVWKFQTEPPVIFDRYQGMNRPPWGNYPPRRLWTPDIPRSVKDGKMPHLEGMGGARNWEESIDDKKKDKK